MGPSTMGPTRPTHHPQHTTPITIHRSPHPDARRLSPLANNTTLPAIFDPSPIAGTYATTTTPHRRRYYPLSTSTRTAHRPHTCTFAPTQRLLVDRHSADRLRQHGRRSRRAHPKVGER